ncbi:cilia- and flagella-associated protein 74 isoform X2 [Rhinoraja longicauda]
MEEEHNFQNENEEEESKLDSEQEVKQGMDEQLCEHHEAMMESDDEIQSEDDFEITQEESEEEVDSSQKKGWSYSVKREIRKRRRITKELEFLLLEKDLEVKKIREELKECRRRMETLKQERDKVEKDIQEQETADNIAALFRLRTQHRRLCEELREEEDIYSTIDLIMQEKEREVFQVELEQAKLLQLHEEHKKDEEEYEIYEAKQRHETKEAAILQAEQRTKKTAIKKKPVNDLKDRELEHKKAVENAKKYNQKAMQFLKESMARVRQEQAEKELKIREDMDKRMQSVLSLKKNIAFDQENQRAIQMKMKAQAARERQMEKEKEKGLKVLESGFAQQFLIHQKHQQEMDQKKQEFAEQQKISKAEIMAKILREESNMERKKQVSSIFPEKSKMQGDASGTRKPRKKLQGFLEQAYDNKSYLTINEPKGYHAASPESEEETATEQSLEHHIPDKYEEDENLNQPEFSGLWDYDQKQCKDEPIKKHLVTGATKMEQAIFERQLERQRNGIIKKQVAADREFKGCPFYSKPGVVHFENFDVGKTYKKKVMLINASYGITYCKLIDISDHVKDFIEIEFKPPGPVSAGMSCEMTVIFQPMQNVDLEGEIMFQAQIGPFTVPLKCTTKKCDLSVDRTLVDFGPHVIGEMITQTITLTNRGAQGSLFEFIQMDFTSSAQMEEPRAEYSISASKKNNQERDLFEIDFPVSNEIKIGQVTKNMIGPFSSIKLPIIFLPLVPGIVHANLEFVFAYGAYRNIVIKVQAEAIDVPVWISNPNIDLKICMYDRLYQDGIRVHNRDSIAHQVKFVVSEELKNHLEFLPKSNYIQAHSSLNFQLKFVPRQSLPEDAKMYFYQENLVLQAPMHIWVANQIRLIPFTVHAVVTSSDIQIHQQTIDFGPCSVYETVLTTVQLTNKSILSQEFGFVDVPEYVDVQPNHGFGVLLPLETLNLDIMFKAKQAKKYNFGLICKSEINRDFKISCQAIGVLPPLHLSHSVVHFAATALYDMATVTLYVVNSHTSRNEFTHPVPRIGTGEIALVGPSTFEFIVPESSSLTIVPAVGTVKPGQKCKVVIAFKPMLSDLEVQEEAVRMLCRAEETRRILENLEMESVIKPDLDIAKKKKTPLKKDLKERSPSPPKQSVKEISSPFNPPDPSDIAVDSSEYNAALASLLRSFKGGFQSFSIPCFIMDGVATSQKNEGPPPYNIHNTLYLEVNCPTVNPPLVLVSCNKQNIVHFGEHAVEQRVLKKVMIQNISQDDLDIKSTVLDPGGPFQLLSCLQALQPGEVQNLVFSFTPTESKMLQNATTLNVMFDVKLESLSYTKHKDQQKLPPFLTSDEIPDDLVGTQNYGGQSVFSVSPIEGCIEAMQTQEFEVTFSPDHEGFCYSDIMHVELFDKVSHSIQLKGAAKKYLMFVEGGDPIDVSVESLSILPSYEQVNVTDVPRPLVLLTLKSTKSDNKYSTPLREFQVGCIRSTQLAGKKSVEFIIDYPQAVQLKGFTFEPARGIVEAGNTKTVSVTWTPPAGHDPLQTISAMVKMTIKGDITEYYQIILMAMVIVT